MVHEEVEVKIRMEGPDAARAALQRLGVTPKEPRHLEDNVLFDDARSSIRARGRTLRLRRVSSEVLLTFKGPRRDSEGLKRRDEIEVGLSDAAGLQAVLEALGYRPAFRYQKYRASYAWRNAEIVVDETPIGTFLEIEGPPETIHAAAHSLGFGPSDYITASYAALFFRSGGQGDMVFS